jgi:Holliday junction resolvase-like predicted endonuclease|tara:strand:- start:139 stop:648 length:510 start_codon:yes stop_codon:yes gene_type:complete
MSKKAEKGKQGELLVSNIFSKRGYLVEYPEDKYASEADIVATNPTTKHVLKVEVKCQTPEILNGRLAYPYTNAQVKKLSKVDEVWFVCTNDSGLREDLRNMNRWEGNVYSIPSSQLLAFIKHNISNTRVFKTDSKGKDRFLYPIINMKLEGKVDTRSLRGDGTSMYHGK